jgi:hypothetical protein
MRYIRNVQGHSVELQLVEVDPVKVRLDPSNPRIRYAMQQLPAKDRNENACALILIAQEETESLKQSILRSGGVQEPIYLRHDGRVAEGNRRVVATRLAGEEKPHDSRFLTITAWRIPKSTPEKVIQDLLNEIHIGSVRGWAPYEKAMQIRALVRDEGLLEEEVAERYRMTPSQVQQQIAAVDFMEKDFLPKVEDPSDPEHRSKYSYFLEFEKNSKIMKVVGEERNLRATFAKWVRDGKIYKGVQVRVLPKILASPPARKLLAMRGYKAAKEYLAKTDATEHDLYGKAIELTEELGDLGLDDLESLKASDEQQDVLRELKRRIEHTLSFTS